MLLLPDLSPSKMVHGPRLKYSCFLVDIHVSFHVISVVISLEYVVFVTSSKERGGMYTWKAWSE